MICALTLCPPDKLNHGKTLLTPNVTLCLEGRQTEFRNLQDSSAVVLHALSAAALRFESEEQARRMPGLLESLTKLWDGILDAAKQSTCSHLIVSLLDVGPSVTHLRRLPRRSSLLFEEPRRAVT